MGKLATLVAKNPLATLLATERSKRTGPSPPHKSGPNYNVLHMYPRSLIGLSHQAREI